MNNLIRIFLIGLSLGPWVSCTEKKPFPVRFREAFNFDLPVNAQNVVVSEPQETEKWNQNYMIVEWNFSVQEMEMFLSKRIKDYTRWRKLSEFSVGNHFFTYEQMPHALMADWRGKDAIRVLAVDLSKNKVYACFWLN